MEMDQEKSGDLGCVSGRFGAARRSPMVTDGLFSVSSRSSGRLR